MLTRRFILAAAAATAAASAIPPAFANPPAAAKRLKPAWVAGTDGEFNFQVVRAPTREEAIARYIAEEMGFTACECAPDEDGDCDFCFHTPDVYRVEMFDSIEKPTPGDWLRADMGHSCSRCGYETFAQDGGYAVGDEAVCEGCMTLEDWDKVDPERAAELREDLAHG